MNDLNLNFESQKYDKSEKIQFGAKPRLKKACRTQIEMQTACLDDLISPDHPVRSVWHYVDKLDLTKKLNTIKSIEGVAGRPAVDPKILVCLWLYATIEGIGSAHVLNAYTKEHLAFKWICGGVDIERKTISQFRSENNNLFDDLLAQGVAILIKSGTVTIEEVAQDGLRVRASAGRGSFKKEHKIKDLYAAARERIAKLKAEIEDDPSGCKNRLAANKIRASQDKIERLERAEKEFYSYAEQCNEARRKHKKKALTETERNEMKVSATDSDARVMKMADGGFRPAYNIQFGVDTSKTIVLSVDATNAGTDGGQMLSMYEKIRDAYQKSPRRYLADGGYKNKADIEQLTKMGCEVFVPVQENAKGEKKAKDPFIPKKNESVEIEQWRRRMGQEESKVIYKRRASTVELVNANARLCVLERLTVRGINKVKKVATMFAVAYNMIRTISMGVLF